jgi:GTP cyclohydrolase II
LEANHRLSFAADLRDYATSAAELGGLGVRSVRLMTNNPHKVQALEGLGASVAERVPLLAGWNQHTRPAWASVLTSRGASRNLYREDWTLSW